MTELRGLAPAIVVAALFLLTALGGMAYGFALLLYGAAARLFATILAKRVPRVVRRYIRSMRTPP